MKPTILLLLRFSEVRDEFDLSASDKLIPPSVPISLSELSENEILVTSLQQSSSEVRVEFNLSTSDNSSAPSLPIILSVLSENEMKQRFYYS
jgi:hypothetical protein